MTLDQAIALSLVPDLSRVGLTARLQSDDLELLELSTAYVPCSATVRERAASAGIRVLPWNDPAFPPGLLAISDCPPALWYRGDLACLDAVAVAIVGSRAASPVSRETATRIAADLAARGVTVVSGLARGVDSAAHRGALTAGRTAAVLGSGIDRIYPPEHADLAIDIAHLGLVLSEYPPGTAPLPFHFPMRNRLISGLSRAVVVIEASEKSGSLITAMCALEQGRDVMAVPGSVAGGRNRGGHGLIRDGAKIVECADDIVEELALPAGPAPGDAVATDCQKKTCDDPWLRNLPLGEPLDLDALVALSGLSAARLLRRLLELELQGRIRRLEAGRFIAQERTC
jgi:DNA processing protein